MYRLSCCKGHKGLHPLAYGTLPLFPSRGTQRERLNLYLLSFLPGISLSALDIAAIKKGDIE